MNKPSRPLPTEYSPEQRSQIDKALADAGVRIMGTFIPELEMHDSFVTYTWSDRIVERGTDRFALFGSLARQLLLRASSI